MNLSTDNFIKEIKEVKEVKEVEVNQIVKPINIDNKNDNSNEITLQYLINPILYNKLLQKNVLTEELNIDFYKERIINITNSLLNTKVEEYYHPEIKQIFQQYCKIIIAHFIQEDTNDIYQSQLQEYNDHKSIAIDNDYIDDNIDDNIDTDLTIANTKKIIDKNSNLDNFVIKTNIHSIKQILPTIKKIDITTDAHKYKGIKK